jgi:hypothetical protein
VIGEVRCARIFLKGKDLRSPSSAQSAAANHSSIGRRFDRGGVVDIIVADELR